MLHKVSLLMIFLVSLGLKAQVIQKHWVETFNWQGFGTLYTDQFRVFGKEKEWRIRYKTLNNGPLTVTFHDQAAGKAYPVVHRKNGRTLGYDQYKFTPGDKYLFIQGSLGGWRVSIEEYLDSVEEWNYLKYEKQKPPLQKVAAWAGESTQEICHKAEQAWKLEFEQIGDGLLQIQAFDATGNMVFDSLTSKAGNKGGGWIYAQGTYSIKITTSDVSWCVYALTSAVAEAPAAGAEQK